MPRCRKILQRSSRCFTEFIARSADKKTEAGLGFFMKCSETTAQLISLLFCKQVWLFTRFHVGRLAVISQTNAAADIEQHGLIA